MAIADRAPVLLDLRRERSDTGIARVIAAWRREAGRDPEPVAVLEAAQLSDRSPVPWEPRRLRAFADAAGATVLHSAYPYLLVPPGLRNVLTLHDTLQLDRDLARRTVARALLRRNLRHAAAVVTVSAFARDALCARLDLDPDRVVVAHNGVEPAEPGSPDTASPYALYVGNARPHKHVDELVAWAPQALGARGLRLVCVVGAADRERLAGHGPAAGVELRSGVPEAELQQLMARATLYVSLAEGEGFGLPPLEAAARGVPAVLHDAGAHREVCAAGAAYCELDRDAFTATVTRALGDRGALGAAAQARAQELSWAASWSAVRVAHRRALAAG